MLNPGLIDSLGYAAAGLVLATFSAHSLRALRSLAIVSNVVFIMYAALAHLAPVLLLHALLLPLNVWRLRDALRADGMVQWQAAVVSRNRDGHPIRHGRCCAAIRFLRRPARLAECPRRRWDWRRRFPDEFGRFDPANVRPATTEPR